MIVPSRTANYQLLLHFTVLIFGFTAILGRLISLEAHILVIAITGIGVYIAWSKNSLKIPVRDVLNISTTGLLISAHWVLFFAAIKASNVSITLVCLSVSPLIVAFIEPFVFKRRVRPYEVAFGMMVVIGLWFIFRFESRHMQGIILALTSTALASVFAVINGRLILRFSSPIISLYELAGGFAGLTVFNLITGVELNDLILDGEDLFYLLILGLVCTAFAFISFVEVMKVISPYTVMLSVNLEPVYGIILALIIFGESEYMTPGFYAGAVLILATILGNGWVKRSELLRRNIAGHSH